MSKTHRVLGTVIMAMSIFALCTTPAFTSTARNSSDETRLTLRPATGAQSRMARPPNIPDGAEGPFLIASSYNDFCLDADLNTIGENGTKVQLWTCTDGNTNQWWWSETTDSGHRRFISHYSGQHLDANLNNIGQNGSEVQLWEPLAGVKNQQWKLEDSSGESFRISSVHSGQYLDANLNNIGQNGSEVYLWESLAGVKNQMWY
ncbi:MULTISPECIES: RICIN domain-containing protein [unclassified Actinopolyspora]|uniref:RICIN domain-containing protein n=1 Tax=unclassified Actinopolyspora TaxID=2639451 RepID=UPI0013F60774|nr:MULTISPECIES: RICIN domain-containing protein [unclassified Actinopolyspora]NHD18467.1 ricin-type beta-trefoil lectin domain protein [Actinopolyspora sp. BKK2]NHE77574.1 ricin-type beta-trefoil lectin domain protein [Actinopolyspora sp. BKK1]